MFKAMVLIICLTLIVGGALVLAQDSTATGGIGTGNPSGIFAIIVGAVGLIVKAVVEWLTRRPKIPNQVAAAVGGLLTVLCVWGIATVFKVDYEYVLGAISTGGFLGSLGNTARKPNP